MERDDDTNVDITADCVYTGGLSNSGETLTLYDPSSKVIDTANGNGGPGLGVGLENLEQRVRRFAGPDARVTAGPRGNGGYSVRLSWLVPAGGAS